MLDLNSARIFAQVVVNGSLSGASRALGMPVATVSRRLSEMEEAIGTRLIERTTRKLRLTDSGAILYEYVSRGVEEMDSGMLALSENEKNIKGRLRLSLPPSFKPMWVLLDNYSELYPNVEIDIFVSERKLDFIEDGIDIALRIGEVTSETAVARQLCTYRHKLVASPQFVEKHSVTSPKDILTVKSAAWSKKNQIVKWQLGGKIITLNPYLQVNDYLQLMHIALRNKCVTELPPFFIHSHLESGELVEVLPNFPLPEQAVQLVYPSRKSVSRITRVFIDYCVEHFRI
jgi:DNA-binding transcriptional LysR family regulator